MTVGQADGWDNSRSAGGGDRNSWLIATVVSIATFMQVLDTSIANVALRQIAGSLGAGADESTWIVTTYLVASAIIIPISGWLSAVGAIGRQMKQNRDREFRKHVVEGFDDIGRTLVDHACGE
jgi:DHA2 family multidrug resistance protein